jgi:Protein of unknown function (DUF998)
MSSLSDGQSSTSPPDSARRWFDLTMPPMKWQRFTVVCGLLGPLIMIIGSLVAAMPYEGKKGEAYSPLNHFISELGELGVSQNASVFNLCLIAGGVVLVGFMLGLGVYLATRLGYLAAAVGIWSGLSCSVVGMVPMNNLPRHMRLADSFFYSGLATTLLFSLAIVADRNRKLPKWLVLPGLLAALCFSAFLALPHLSGIPRANALDPSKIVRPSVWVLPLLEWSVFVSIVIWIVAVTIALAWKRKQYV